MVGFGEGSRVHESGDGAVSRGPAQVASFLHVEDEVAPFERDGRGFWPADGGDRRALGSRRQGDFGLPMRRDELNRVAEVFQGAVDERRLAWRSEVTCTTSTSGCPSSSRSSSPPVYPDPPTIDARIMTQNPSMRRLPHPSKR
jgi:hypothetical protein